ncbi:MAG: T9SS type A sorting domain-containing protein [Ignavibacteria bacterium]
MKRLTTISVLFFILLNSNATAQLFRQTFDSALTAGNLGSGTIISNASVTSDPVYVNSSASDSQFTFLSTNNAIDSIEIKGDGVMRLIRSGSGTVYITRNVNFAGAPNAIQFSFDFYAEKNAANSGQTVQFMVGSGFPNSNNEPSAANKHSRFFINTKSAPSNTWGVTPENASSASAYTDTQTVVWVINNTGQSLDYSAPDGSIESLGNDSYDVWVGETKEIDEAAAITDSTNLNNFQIRIGGGTGVYAIDNMVITKLIALGVPDTGDYGSVDDGNWSDVSTWAQWDGTGWNTVPSAAPTGSVNVFINLGHTVTVDVAQSISGNLTVDGYLKDVGVLTAAGINIFNDSSTYEFAHAAASGQGIPSSTWRDGSTCLITGITNASTGLNANQEFYNFIVDCRGWTGNLNFGWGGTSSSSPTTINGNVTVRNTGAGRWQWCAPTAGTADNHHTAAVTINGDLILEGSTANADSLVNVTSNGTGNSYVDITINILGDVIVTGNPASLSSTNFSISRGSLGNLPDSGSSCTWNLYGGFSISNATTQNSDTTGKQGKFVFAGSGVQNFTGNNVVFGSSKVQFAVNAGSILQLNSPMQTYSLILNGVINSSAANPLILGYLTGSGSFQVSNDNPIVGGSSTAFVNGPMGFLMVPAGTKAYKLPIGKDGVFRPLNLSVTHSASDTTIYAAELFNTAPAAKTLPGTLDKVSDVRYFTVTKTGDAVVDSASVQLSYGTDDGVTDAVNLRIAKDDGSGNWLDLGGTGSANDSGTISSAVNFTSFSDFVIANAVGGTNPVPVELTSFTADVNGQNVNLKWTTASEINNRGWDVERKQADKKSSLWEKTGFVEGSGNKTELSNYSFADKNAGVGKYLYRLKQIDFDGASKYSQVLEVVISGPREFALYQNYPNPFNPATLIKFDVPEASFVNISVFNSIGEKVATVVNEKMEPGSYSRNFNAGSLSSGIYIYRLNTDKAVLIKKMMLVK